MTILVTGGAGCIGSRTCMELLSAGYDVVVVDNFYNSSEKAPQKVEQITGRKVIFYEVDLLDQLALKNVSGKENIESVIYFAGLKTVDKFIYKPLEYYRNNTAEALILCDETRDHRVKDIVFSSSVAVYGDPAKTPVTENCPKGEITNPCGRTRGMLEQVLTDLHIADDQWSVVLLRYFNSIGAHKSGLIDEDPKGIPNNLVPHIAQMTVDKLGHFNVLDNDYDTLDGIGVRDYTHMVDLAKGHVKAVKKLEDRERVNIYDLGTGVGYSMLGVLHAYGKAYNQTLKYEIRSRRDGDMAVYYSNSAKAGRELGWGAEKGIGEVCADSWR